MIRTKTLRRRNVIRTNLEKVSVNVKLNLAMS